MDSQGSVSSVMSESGRDWLDFIDAPEDFSQEDLGHIVIEETVRTYFDFPDLTENDVNDHEDESAASVNDLDTESTADLSASASAADYDLPPHEDDFLDLSSEDVRETVVRT